jgi:hypothetical protein
VIDGEDESHVINEEMVDTINLCLITPDIGLPYPFEIINELFKGMKEYLRHLVDFLRNWLT